MLREKNRFQYWYPKIAQLTDIPMPKTKILALTPKDTDLLHESVKKFVRENTERIDDAIDGFTFPIFLKGDFSSVKHQWKSTSCVPNRGALGKHISEIIYHMELNNNSCQALIFRELLNLESPFTFFDGDLPIAKERRYFVKDGRVICRHPYWDISLFEKRFEREDVHVLSLQASGVATKYTYKYPHEYRDRIRAWIRELNHETEEEIHILSHMASKISSVMDGAWSVDFACDVNGKWWFIDMGLAKESGHLKSCPYSDSLL